MMHRLLAVLLLVAAVAAVPSSAQAAACSGSSGVTVVVDYDDGRVQAGCAPGDPISGYDALVKAGFHPTYADGNGRGALCSINQVPDHACPSMPPADEYWAYFHAKPGGAWGYSSYGGNDYNPKPGTVEGWRFRGSPDDPPRIAPPGSASTPAPTAKPTSPSPAPVSRSTPTTGSGSVRAPGSTPGSTPGSPVATTSSGTTATAGPSGTAPSSGATGTATEGTDPDDAKAAQVPATESGPAATASSGGRSWIWGVLLVGILAAAAGTAAVRRRRS